MLPCVSHVPCFGLINTYTSINHILNFEGHTLAHFCKLQPHKNAFIELASTMDIREFFELAFRNYSVLSKGETIVIKGGHA